MLNYPRDGDTIIVQDVASKHDCRAYRVFRHYIKERAKNALSKLRARDANATRKEAEATVFLCEPCEDGGCSVFVCPSCKRSCHNKTAHGTEYRQCPTASLDLFDGHDPESGVYTCNGIGEAQPEEYANLTVHDRLALSVLKVWANARL